MGAGVIGREDSLAWRKAIIKLGDERTIQPRRDAVSEIGEKYGVYRIVSPRADAAMVKSMRQYGQMTPVVCVKAQGGWELIDGFKRLRACRSLNQTTLQGKAMEVSGRVCKAALIQLNQSGRSINGMEEALVFNLHRTD
jgi:ParB-like chromosome segregation protein Spo0J